MKNCIAVAAWSGLIFALVPTVRPLTTWIGAHFGDNSFIMVTTSLLIIGVGAVLIGARRNGTRISASAGAWLVKGEDRPSRRALMQDANIKGAPFIGKVSAHLITRFSETQMRICTLSLILFLATLFVWIRFEAALG